MAPALAASARQAATDVLHKAQSMTPTTTADNNSETDTESMTPTTTADSNGDSECTETSEEQEPPMQLGAGLYHDLKEDDITPCSVPRQPPLETVPRTESAAPVAQEGSKFRKDMTLFVFDWDDTLLPSSWVRDQGLRLDDGSQLNNWQRKQLAEVAPVVIQCLTLAKHFGTVVMVTSAERGWIELSCRKFLPTVMPHLENIRMVSARTTYEGPRNPTPLDWKMRAFEAELARFYGRTGLQNAQMRKNAFSLGDGAHEREALLRSTASARNCRAKSLKFVEHPELSQIIKQHELIISCFESVVDHDADLDLCISCP